MTDKKHVYESQVITLPPLRLVLGEVPVPDPVGIHKPGREQQNLSSQMEGTVKRLIAHLKDDK
jgi:hypothetical protein